MAVNNNYISINGKKIPLTNEQVEQIKNAGVVKDNPFERVAKKMNHYYINFAGIVESVMDDYDIDDDACYQNANYCTDKKLMEQRALHETLSRLLWRFSMTHGGDEIDWSDTDSYRYIIFYNHCIKSFGVAGHQSWQYASDCYFLDRQTAEQAIKEIVMPFTEQYPEFVW